MMTKLLAKVLLLSLACAVLILAASYFLGCENALPAQYAAEQSACLALVTKHDVDVCRDKVKAKYGRLDAGANVQVVEADAHGSD